MLPVLVNKLNAVRLSPTKDGEGALIFFDNRSGNLLLYIHDKKFRPRRKAIIIDKGAFTFLILPDLPEFDPPAGRSRTPALRGLG